MLTLAFPVAADELPAVGQATPLSRVVIRGDAGTKKALEGRIVVQAADGGVLLEQRDRKLVTATSDQMESLEELDRSFAYLSAEEMSAELLAEFGGGFAVEQTEHFLICSNASARYTDYCGRLLERVHREFLRFFEDSGVKLSPLPVKLPVVVFGQQAAFHDFARRQHPDTDFTDVTGYYSVRDNLMLISALSGDRSFRSNSDVLREVKKRPRQVETIVHEAVHLLAFNTGLQVRFADNPMWLSEGLAVYFERASGQAPVAWSRPGGVSRIHRQGFRNAINGRRLRLPLAELLASDTAFESEKQLADAYAESWALTYFLVRTKRDEFNRLLSSVQKLQPLQPVTGAERLALIQQATKMDLHTLEADLIRYLSRIRSR